MLARGCVLLISLLATCQLKAHCFKHLNHHHHLETQSTTPTSGHNEAAEPRESYRNLDDISGRLEQRPARLAPAGSQGPSDGDTRLPFWNIAHMINSIEQVELALGMGANGIETDVSFDSRSGEPTEAYHGFPCDCGRHCHFREDLGKFVAHLGQLTRRAGGERLQLVLFDLKLKELRHDERLLAQAGRGLATILIRNLYSSHNKVQGGLRSIVSINHASDAPLIRAFIEQAKSSLSRGQLKWDILQQQVGFDVGMNDDLRNISSMWDSLGGATTNIWQGDGLTNCANLARGHERLRQAIRVRNERGHFAKIYYWTADILYQIRAILRLGVDAMLTNQPQRVLQALEEPEFRRLYRLATPHDSPFEQYSLGGDGAGQMSPRRPTLGEALETVQNIKKTSSDFIKTLPDGIGAALKKVRATFV